MDAEEQLRTRQFLAGIPIFGGLPDTAMDRLLEVMQCRTFERDETICKEGDLGREMYVVRSGTVEVRKGARDGGRTISLARLRPGDCFGEMSLIDIQPRSASVMAREKTELYVITNMDLYQLYQQDLGTYVFVVQNICRELSRRLRKADGVIADFFLALEEYVAMVLD